MCQFHLYTYVHQVLSTVLEETKEKKLPYETSKLRRGTVKDQGRVVRKPAWEAGVVMNAFNSRSL